MTFIDNFSLEYREITPLMILQDPTLQDLESNFIIHQKLVEAAKKLASEPDLCKNVKKKRKQEYADAVKKLQEIENSINEYRIKCGKKPTQKSTLALPGERIPHVLMQTGGGKEQFGFLRKDVNKVCIWFLSSPRQLNKKKKMKLLHLIDSVHWCRLGAEEVTV